jgi:hypothetical protein
MDSEYEGSFIGSSFGTADHLTFYAHEAVGRRERGLLVAICQRPPGGSKR